jgi:two-component system, LytTR family, response regulator
MMRVLLVDDEPLALERLQVAMAAIPDATVVGTASDGIEASEKIATLQPDLAILDIQMPGLSGIDLVRSMPATARPDIVFITAFNDFAIEAFEIDATDYLLKPVSFDRLRLAIERVRRRALSSRDRRTDDSMRTHFGPQPGGTGEGRYDDSLWVPSRGSAVCVPVVAIDRIEAARDYILLYTEAKSYILRAKLGDLEKQLDPALMLRIHRSHMVRISAVIGIERPGKGVLRLMLSDGANLQVGPLYQERVMTALGL